jgi:hypothetical protein
MEVTAPCPPVSGEAMIELFAKFELCAV